MKIRWLVVGLILTLLSGNVMAAEEADYNVVVAEDKLEIRDYTPQIVAEVIVNDGFEDAGNVAFRKLFKYISGNNTRSEEIAMTAPVSQQKAGEKIAMTAPVSQRAEGDSWAVSFMMPAEYTLETIPAPSDPEVTIRAIPAQRMAAIRFSGRWKAKNYDKHLAELMAWVETKGLVVSGEPVWARYNAPFVPWFMRRNEILLPVAD
ncbi:MAG: heme-binding protein [Xanthomonadales bacterium]|nr:heme-binding protein [Xanthomonadales bacterium]